MIEICFIEWVQIFAIHEKHLKTVDVSLWKLDKHETNKNIFADFSKCGQYMLDFHSVWSNFSSLLISKDCMTDAQNSTK